MQLTSLSHEYLKLIYSRYKTCMLNKEINPNSNSTETLFFKNLFHQIKIAESYILSNTIQSKITKSQQQTRTSINNPTLYNNSFFPESIKQMIEHNTIQIITYNTFLNKRNINFNFYLQDNDTQLSSLDTYVNYMLIWIHILNSYDESNDCSHVLNVYIYLTSFKKEIPSDKTTILSPEQVNTAYTFNCSKDSEIIIYRKEEWFKVFIHETFHNFGFDFSNMHLNDFNDKISQLFPVNSKFNIYESYCEVWARIINACFCSYTILNNKNNINSFILYCDILLQVERVFSLYQVNKVLEFLGIKYENLYKNDYESNKIRSTLYKEKTSVFAYYVITAILINDYTKFIKWCNENNLSLLKFNKTSLTLDSFYEFIKLQYKNELFIKSLKCIKKINNKYEKQKIKETNDRFFKKSLRMTVLELN